MSEDSVAASDVPEAIESRLHYLGFTDVDFDNVPRLHDLIDEHIPSIMDAFYDHILQFDEVKRIIRSDDLLAMLKQTQARYLVSLGEDLREPGNYAYKYRIGEAHERVGLRQDWFIGAYTRLFSLISEIIVSSEMSDGDRLLTTLQRIFNYDSSIVLESYYNATKDRLETLIEELSVTQRELEKTARTDALTGLRNRKDLMETLDKELYRSRRFKRNMSVLFLDLDHFKNLNDTHGHLFGDFALKETARIMRKSLRGTNILGRYGGEEFAVGLVECDLDSAKIVAERLRSLMAETDMTSDGVTVRVTASIGVAQLSGVDENLEALIHRADQALYQAKEDGRNRVCVG